MEYIDNQIKSLKEKYLLEENERLRKELEEREDLEKFHRAYEKYRRYE